MYNIDYIRVFERTHQHEELCASLRDICFFSGGTAEHRKEN